MRNIEKAIEEGKELAEQRTRLDLSTSELMELAAKSPDVYEIIQNAYWAGLAVGYRNGGKIKNVSFDVYQR